jgi:hypothetical protein
MPRFQTKEPRFPNKQVLSLLVDRATMDSFKAWCKARAISMNMTLTPRVERIMKSLEQGDRKDKPE